MTPHNEYWFSKLAADRAMLFSLFFQEDQKSIEQSSGGSNHVDRSVEWPRFLDTIAYLGCGRRVFESDTLSRPFPILQKDPL